MVGSVVCQECGATAKYTCPRCSTRSCSLQCVKSHKQKSGCTGKRDRTSFVSITEFDDKQLISDYNLLEETLVTADAAKRARREHPPKRRKIHPTVQGLINAARGRNIRLRCMPVGMSKRNSNTTVYLSKNKRISWRVEWFFDSTDVSVADKSVDENACLEEVLKKHLSSEEHSSSIRQQLQPFLKQSVDQLRLLYKKEPCEQGKQVYYELDPRKSLREVLAFKVVIEYPVIRVVFPSRLCKYSIEKNDPVPEAVVAPSEDNAAAEEPEAVKGKTFREEELQEDNEEEIDVFDFLNDLPGDAALWE